MNAPFPPPSQPEPRTPPSNIEAEQPLLGAARSFVVILPWPHRDLHPNARIHWSRRASATKRARWDACALAKSSGVPNLKSADLLVTAVFIPPDGRRRDTDGMLSNIKAYLDGIADAIGIDDSRWTLAIRREPPKVPGEVRIEIHEERV